MGITIVPISDVKTSALKKLTDSEIGTDYYSIKEIEDIKSRSFKNNICCSFVLLEDKEPVGFRFSFAPEQWESGKGSPLSSEKWPYGFKETAYFQSLFLKPQYQKQGWGSQLSKKSIEKLIQVGAKGVVCHSWVESPGNSSGNYLLSLQFKSICKYPKYWQDVDYVCPRCGQPCQCTAEEMYLDLKEYQT